MAKRRKPSESERRRSAPHGRGGTVVESMAGRIAALQRSAGNRAVASTLGQRQVQRQAAPVVQRVELGVDYVVTGHGWTG